jgi:subtilisin family serine protease
VAIGLVLGAPPTSAAPVADPPVNDPGARFQWGLDAVRAYEAWAVARGAGITVAVIDSGVDTSHEDLQGKIAGSVSCLSTGGDASKCTPGGEDDDGHGTHVAGIIAAATNNGTGVAGVAPDANILSVKVLRKPCDTCEVRGSADDVAAAIHYAVDNGAQVLNLSLGSTIQSVLGPAFADAIDYAWTHAVIPVVAAGNDFILASGFSSEPAVVVDALNRSGKKATYSNGVGSAKWAIAAPGGESDDDASCVTSPNGILSTFWSPSNNTSGYACVAGTSMAAPHVAGALAILRSAGLNAQESVDRMLSTAHDIGEPGRDSTYGSGTLDIAAAVADLSQVTVPTSAPTTTTEPAIATTDPTVATQAGVGGGATTTATTALPEPSTTSEAPKVTLPHAESTINDSRRSSDDDLPPGAVAVAVGLALAIGSAAGWQLISGAGWARRTP